MAESTDGDSLLSPNSSTYVISCDDEQGIDTDALDDVPIHKDNSPLLEDQFKDDEEAQKPSATGEGRGTFHTEGRSFSSDHFPTQSKSVEKTIRQRAMFRVFIEVLKDQFVWWEFATAHRDIAFEVAFHYPIPRTVYNTEDALFEGMLTHVEMFQDRCTEKGITVTKTGLLRYMNAMFGEEEVAEKLDEIFKYVQELQDGDPIVDTSRSRKTRGIDRCDDEAREIVDKLSKKVCLVPMARHASHHMVQYGFIQAPDEGQICLTWDNSYSRVRSKVLSLHYEVAEGDCPPASWRAGPQTVQSGPSSRENLIGTTKTKKHKNRFMERLSLMKSLLEQRRRKNSEEETMFFTRAVDRSTSSTSPQNGAGNSSDSGHALNNETGHFLDIGSMTPDRLLRPRVTSAGVVPPSDGTPISEPDVISPAEHTGDAGPGVGVEVLEDIGLLSRTRDRGNTETGIV